MTKMICDFCVETCEIDTETVESGPVFCKHCGIKLDRVAPLDIVGFGAKMEAHFQGGERNEL